MDVDKIQSMSQWQHTHEGALHHAAYGAILSDSVHGRPLPISINSRRYPSTCSIHASVGVPLDSTINYLLQIQPGVQGQLLGSVPHARTAKDDVHELCRY